MTEPDEEVIRLRMENASLRFTISEMRVMVRQMVSESTTLYRRLMWAACFGAVYSAVTSAIITVLVWR